MFVCLCLCMIVRVYVYICVCTGSSRRACCSLFNFEVSYVFMCFFFVSVFVYDCARVCVSVHMCVLAALGGRAVLYSIWRPLAQTVDGQPT